MGMDCIVFAVASAEAELLRGQPERVNVLLSRRMDHERARLAAFKAGKFEDEEPTEWIGLGTTWHWIHWLLTGNAGGMSGDAVDISDPLCFLAKGGDEILGAEVGFGARLFTPDRVQKASDAFANLDDDSVMSRWDPAKMRAANLYPEFPTNFELEEEHRQGIRLSLERIRAFISEGARSGDAVLVVIT